MQRRSLLRAAAVALPTVALAGPGTATSFGTPGSTLPQQTAAEPPLGPLAPTPPMGWNSWNLFGTDIHEDLIKEVADALVSSGMHTVGYDHVNIDDCWAAPDRDPNSGRLLPHPERFPNGIKALADYVHARGLKLGIYSSAGAMTCSEFQPGSLDHEEVDAATFAAWEIDFLKYDNCANQGRPARERYRTMAEALRKAGRPIAYSVCEWGENEPWEWAAELGSHLWRTTDDISDEWSSVLSILDQQVGLSEYSGPHAWNDPDMLEVGNGGMTTSEYRAHFSLWSLLNAPLLTGHDPRDMDTSTRDILLNRDLIAVNQDWGGRQGDRVRNDGATEVWAKPMSDGSATTVLFNQGTCTAPIEVTTAELGLSGQRYMLRELWTKRESVTTTTISAAVPAHDVAVYRVWPE